MKLEIESVGFPMTESMRGRVRRKLARLTMWNRRILKSVSVTLGEVEVSQVTARYCRVVVELRNGEVISVEKVSDDLVDAIKRATAATNEQAADAIRRAREESRPRGLGILF